MARPGPPPLVDAASLSEAVTGTSAILSDPCLRYVLAVHVVAQLALVDGGGWSSGAGCFCTGRRLPLDNAYERLVSAVGLLAAEAPCWPVGDLAHLLPQHLAAALSAGYLHFLERVLRALHRLCPEAGAMVASPPPAKPYSWSFLGRLPAHGEPRRAATLLPTTAKLLRWLLPGGGAGGKSASR
ncbi:hypothetical protein TSOC_008261 [Tetrabaena socialis]|uniref:Uncharacterized protein n=1 Tax=Tetrabaena socialis TaxID=47790 RepID=A0A2J7ZYT6_9CHLO|nr:hypothetical protein TSOC_008261 [Tetrabaena socialis]|eukprot:PNH05435.1 hypothetical protein TSOC_008261 [Tetrabaena socialis]